MSDTKPIKPKKCAPKSIDEPKKRVTKKTIDKEIDKPLQKMPITRVKSSPTQLVMCKSGHIPDCDVFKKLWDSISKGNMDII